MKLFSGTKVIFRLARSFILARYDASLSHKVVVDRKSRNYFLLKLLNSQEISQCTSLFLSRWDGVVEKKIIYPGSDCTSIFFFLDKVLIDLMLDLLDIGM